MKQTKNKLEKISIPELSEILHGNTFIRGGLVEMKRVCGKPNCHCVKGKKHVSLYLACRYKNKRKMIYIPPEKEEIMRECVHNHRKIMTLLEDISNANVEKITGV